MTQVIHVNQEEWDAINAEIGTRAAARAAKMPDDTAAVAQMHEAWVRLQEMGWREPMYAPKDGTLFEVIEAGSTGIHVASYVAGGYMAHDDNDLWPCTPTLFRLFPADEAKRKAKMAEAIARYAAEYADDEVKNESP